MKAKKSTKLLISGLVGCGLCCLILFLPIATGAFGASILGFTLGQVVCGVFFLMVGIALLVWYFVKKKNLCDVSSG